MDGIVHDFGPHLDLETTHSSVWYIFGDYSSLSIVSDGHTCTWRLLGQAYGMGLEIT